MKTHVGEATGNRIFTFQCTKASNQTSVDAFESIAFTSGAEAGRDIGLQAQPYYINEFDGGYLYINLTSL